MRRHDFFPTPVWVTQLPAETAARVNRTSVALVEGLRSQMPELRPGDPWQTPNDLQTRPELDEFLGIARAAASQALDDLQVAHGGFLITGCWANIKPRGTAHGIHRHPNNFLSGVYYVRAQGETGMILFHDPRVQTGITVPNTSEKNELNSRRVNLPVRDGMLVVFPSWLSHSVARNESAEERISISFNVMFARFGEQMAQPHFEGTMT